MVRLAAMAAVVLAALSGLEAPAGAQEPRFVFEFASASPVEYEGVSGKPFGPFEIFAAIRPVGLEGSVGPQGWSIGVEHDPILELLQVTLEGTNAGDLFDRQDGYLRIDMVDPAKNGGKVGYVAATVLSLEGSASLPPDRSSTVLSATYRGTLPTVQVYTEKEIIFEYADGLIGSAEPVINNVSCASKSYFPDFLPLSRKLKTTPSCNSGLGLDLDAPGSTPEGDVRKLRLEIPAAQDLVIDVTARLSVQLAGPNGPEGWSLSVQHDRSFFQVLEATTAGTDAEQLADPEERYLKTDIIDGDDGAGFISAVILSLAGPRTLPPAGDFTVARARYRLAARHDKPGQITATPIRFEDGLKGGDQPVVNIITVEGKTEYACMKRSLQVDVNVVPGGKVFFRGDVNNDGRLNITDPIWLALWLYIKSIPSLVCTAASDANGDLQVDGSDMITLLDFLFLAGPPLPEPYRRCAPDPRPDDPLDCDVAAVKCP